MGFEETFNTRVMPAADRAFGVLVKLTHGPQTTEAFTAQWEDQVHEIVDSEGFTTKFHGRDFMFAVSDVVADGLVFEPRKGDVIAVTENGTAKQFEILPVGNLKEVALMPGGFRWRVRTKRVS